jgi:class 3 adenylate cyclase
VLDAADTPATAAVRRLPVLRKLAALFHRPRLVFRLRSRRLATNALHRHELSVVAFDLRGFTSFLERRGPESAVELLRRYYAVVADEVARHGGVVKDHAGDGVLVLVGAAEPCDDSALRALRMALAVRRRAAVALALVGDGGGVGIGAGIATGPVTVGTIDAGRSREAVAVGAAVNLAARLCALAEPGRILVDETTVGRLSATTPIEVEPLAPLRLKGFAEPVRAFVASSGGGV